MQTKAFTECIDIVGSVCNKFLGFKNYISTGAVDEDHINNDSIELVDFNNKPSRANLIVKDGDVLFAKMQGTKKTLLINKNLEANIYSTGFFAIAPNKTIITNRCLYHLVSSKSFLQKKDKFCSGATQKAITNSGLSKIQIKVPDISLQDNIADQLDLLQSIITHRRTQLEKLDLLVKARFVEMFGEVDLTPQKQNWISISEIGTIVGGSTPKTSIEEYWDGDLKWITPAELDLDTGYIYDSVRKITKKGAESCSLQLLPKNTVILTSRAPIGKVAIVGSELYCNQGFKNIICKDMILPRYLYSLLLFNTEYLNSLGRGATFKEISKSIVEKIKIPLPPLDLQTQFADFVKQVDKSKVAVQKELDKAQMLFDSLMQEYFG